MGLKELFLRGRSGYSVELWEGRHTTSVSWPFSFELGASCTKAIGVLLFVSLVLEWRFLFLLSFAPTAPFITFPLSLVLPLSRSLRCLFVSSSTFLSISSLSLSFTTHAHTHSSSHLLTDVLSASKFLFSLSLRVSPSVSPSLSLPSSLSLSLSLILTLSTNAGQWGLGTRMLAPTLTQRGAPTQEAQVNAQNTSHTVARNDCLLCEASGDDAEGEGKSLREELLALQTEASTLEADEKKKQLEIAHLTERITVKEGKLGKSRLEGKKLVKEKLLAESLVEKKRSELECVAFDPQAFAKALEHARESELALQSLQESGTPALFPFWCATETSASLQLVRQVCFWLSALKEVGESVGSLSRRSWRSFRPTGGTAWRCFGGILDAMLLCVLFPSVCAHNTNTTTHPRRNTSARRHICTSAH